MQLYDEKLRRSSRQPTTDRICEAACALAEAGKYQQRKTEAGKPVKESGDYKGILVPTASGRTAFMVSRLRPTVQIIGAAHYQRTFRKLFLSFGVRPIFIGARKAELAGEVRQDAVEVCMKSGILLEGDEFVYTAGTPLYAPGTVNLLHIHRVGGEKTAEVEAD